MIRLSYGTAVKMGLKRGKMLVEPTTAYIMLGERCVSNCAFCAQRRDSPKTGYLSRVMWPAYPEEVLSRIRGFSRICFQTLDYLEVVSDLLRLLRMLPRIPVSVSMVPVSHEDMLSLRDAGVEIMSIALDASNPQIFEEIKGAGVGNRFTWEGHWEALRRASRIFPQVNTHLIVGLGESDSELVAVMQTLWKMGISTALFSYTPVFGGTPPPVGRYRAVQLARFLIYRGSGADVVLERGRIVNLNVPESLRKDVLRGVPFLTSGCPGCNRPFYNERPGGTMYNYPRIMSREEVENAIMQLREYTELSF
ncbi:MAG: radical SAM protein [Euryarchaeota archaeon]|nr:radical SAM protein [Euryarchaeota archaeon]